MWKQFLILTIATSSLSAYAETTYQHLLAKLDEHPALEAVRQQVIQQQESAAGANGLPDPMLMFGINNYPANGKGGFDRFAMTNKSIGFIQKIPNGSVRAASATAKLHLASKAQVAVNYTSQQLKTALNIALAELKRIKAQNIILQQDTKLLKQEAAYWKGRLQSGDSALDEHARVMAELAQVEAKIATLGAEETQYKAELNRLVSTSKVTKIPTISALPWPNAHAIYPVLLAQKDVLVANANVSGAKSAFMPNYQVGVSYGQRDNSGSFDGGDLISAKFGLSVPLWAGSNQAPKLRSTLAGVKRAKAMLANVESQWQQNLATQYAKIKETQATKKAFKEKETAIKTQISSLYSAYEADGRLDKLIAAKRSLLSLQLQLAELSARYIKQISAYNSVFQQPIQTGENSNEI